LKFDVTKIFNIEGRNVTKRDSVQSKFLFKKRPCSNPNFKRVFSRSSKIENKTTITYKYSTKFCNRCKLIK